MATQDTTPIQARLPARLLAEARALVDEGWYRDLDDLLAEAAGLDGLEVYYPTHSPQQVAFYRRQAEAHGLLITAGGDSHGPKDPLRPRPAADCAAFLARMGVDLD